MFIPTWIIIAGLVVWFFSTATDETMKGLGWLMAWVGGIVALLVTAGVLWVVVPAIWQSIDVTQTIGVLGVMLYLGGMGYGVWALARWFARQ